MSISPVKIWRNQKKLQKILGKTGKIISYSTVYVPPAGFEKSAPYTVVLVQMDDKNRYIGQYTDWSKTIKIGQKVIAVLRKTRETDSEGIIPYGIKFKPL